MRTSTLIVPFKTSELSRAFIVYWASIDLETTNYNQSTFACCLIKIRTNQRAYLRPKSNLPKHFILSQIATIPAIIRISNLKYKYNNSKSDKIAALN